ncbi:MAG: transglutaminase-like domain-containing protein [Rhodothermaceae bacterium]|nr:transglutaminase-like domain-containing protein [Rhodothermaceae bacterium]
MLYQPTVKSEIKALVSLLDDPDQVVQEAIHLRFKELGRRAIPALQEAHKKMQGSDRDKIGRLMQELHFKEIESHWRHIMRMPDAELEHGVFLLALHRFPGLNVKALQAQLDEMAQYIKPKVDSASGVGKAFVLSSFLCNELGFKGNNEHFSDPNNSYINCVIEARRGIPVTLCTIFILLGRRLGLPIYGVNMPAHFLAKYQDETHEVFFDIFNGGNPIVKEQCIQFLIKAGIKPQAKYFQAASGQTILLRMICNLLAVSQAKKKSRFVKELGILMEPWKNSSHIS